MFNNFINYHKELISAESRTSSARYMALMSFYVSSVVVAIVTVWHPVHIVALMVAYMGTYTAAYLGGKLIGAMNKEVKQ